MTSSKRNEKDVHPNQRPSDTESQKYGLSKVSQFSEQESSFLLGQYVSLREEVLKRIELQHQLILGAVVTVGTILTISIQGGGPFILSVYPFLAIFLTLAWSQNDHRNRQITQYLSEQEEFFLTDAALGWEHSRSSSRLWFFGSRKVFAARGIFIGSQILAISMFWLQNNSVNQNTNPNDWILIFIDLAVIFTTVLIIGFPSRQTISNSQ